MSLPKKVQVFKHLELIEYGLFLGLDLPRDQAYLYLAR
jgi:hypothetical protein